MAYLCEMELQLSRFIIKSSEFFLQDKELIQIVPICPLQEAHWNESEFFEWRGIDAWRIYVGM